ncbi:hypothetical protein ACIPW5_06595 [Streptomyces sp. NPDC090077]|uniref:hypothetical protein n=1 Tax=Streptomyces sp. NPDC090077 TaxID=3365938 RepID=UPI00382EEE62
MNQPPYQQQTGGYGHPGQQPPPWGGQPPKPAGWTTQKKIAVIGGSVFGLALLGGIVGPDEEHGPAAATPAPTVTVTTTATVTVTAAPPPPVQAPATDAAPAATSASPAAAATTAAPATGTLPNFVGHQLQASQDGAQAAGFYILSSDDATGAGRMQILDRNWKVCGQTPKPGTHDLTTRVTFSTVKNEETCP